MSNKILLHNQSSIYPGLHHHHAKALIETSWSYLGLVGHLTVNKQTITTYHPFVAKILSLFKKIIILSLDDRKIFLNESDLDKALVQWNYNPSKRKEKKLLDLCVEIRKAYIPSDLLYCYNKT